MKRIASICALTLVAACGAEREPEPVATEAAVAAAPARDWPGNYEITLPDGATGTTVIAADGTYERTVGDAVETGTWVDGSATGEPFCFDPEGDIRPLRCYTMGEPGEDGTFAADPGDGTEPVMARRVST